MTPALAAYQAVGWFGLALGWPLLLLRAARDPRFRVGWGERLGFWGEGLPRGAFWIHGASLGEVNAAALLASRLRQRGARLVLTATSPAGRGAARALAADGDAARLLPLDLTLLLGPVFRRIGPRALILLETELWPSLLWEAARSGVPVVLASGRISPKAFPRYRRLRPWLRPLLRALAAVLAQSPEDAERFAALGVPPERVRVGGNLKFDGEAPDPADPLVRQVRDRLPPGALLWVAGSTHPGEEEALLAALERLEAGGLQPTLLLAPRHLERLGEVEALLRRQGRAWLRWSESDAPVGPGSLLLVDRYGLLARMYGAAACAFVGGTLAPVGGHSLLEPLRWGVPVLFGPHTENLQEVRDAILGRGLGVEVSGAETLATAAETYFRQPGARAAVDRRAQDLFRCHRGATERVLGALAAAGTLPQEA